MVLRSPVKRKSVGSIPTMTATTIWGIFNLNKWSWKMKYSYMCDDCGKIEVYDIPIKEYKSNIIVWCHNINKHRETGKFRMGRIYFSTQVQFHGEGFTGAGGALPHMDKQKRKKDLASKTDVEGI